MAQYNKISMGRLSVPLVAGVASSTFVQLPFMPEQFEFWNRSEWASSNATSQIAYATGFAEDPSGTAYVTENTAGAATLTNSKVTSGGFTFFAGGFPASGATVTGTSVTQATPAVVTINSHGFITGDTVWLWGTTGMLQIAGAPYTVTKTGTNTFTIPVDSSGFAAAATAVSAKLWFGLAIPDTYTPFICTIVAISTGTSTTITTSIAPHTFVVGQQVSFVIPPQWGMTQLNGLKGFVTSVTATTLVVNINSTSFTAFSYPTSATAAAGITLPQVFSVGDQNFGSIGPVNPFATPPISIPGAFQQNTSAGVIIGGGLITAADVGASGPALITWRAIFPDQYIIGTGA